MRRREMWTLLAVTALLLPVLVAIPAGQAVSLVSPARVDSICQRNYTAAKNWSHKAPIIESDEDMAALETGVGRYFGWTAADLRSVGALTLATHFGRVSAGHRAAAVAYLSGSLARVNQADAQLRVVSTRAMNAAGAQHAPTCVAFVADYR